MKPLCLALLLLPALASAQDWVNLWTPDVSNRAGHDIVVTDAGEVFAVGMTPIGSQPPFQRAAVVKYSASTGERQWVCYFDVPAANGDNRSRLAVLPGGVVGVTCAAGSNGDGVLSVFACSRDGDSLWQYSHDTGGYGGDRPCDIATDPGGNVYVTGPTATDSTGWDIYTAKLSPQGQLVWERRFDGPAHRDDYGSGMVLDDSGNAYVAGAVWNALLRQRPTILKYSPSGSLVWARLLGPEGGTSGSYNDIALGRGGCLYAAGRGWSSTWGPITRYSFDGDSLWADSLPGEVHAVATDGSGNLYTTGSVVREACVRKLSSSGTPLWERRLKDWPQASAAATDLKVVGTDGVAAAGYTSGEETGADLVVARYSAGGDSLWVGKYRACANTRFCWCSLGGCALRSGGCCCTGPVIAA